jgi:small subunit ribosomal protein S6
MGPMLHCRDFLPRHGPPFPSVPAAGEADSDRGKEESGTVTDYEVLLMLDPELPEERQGEIVTRVRERVETDGGTWDGHQPWGRRRLAYEIEHKHDAHYHLLTFASEAATLDEVARVLRITDGVMRHMATRRIEGGLKTPPPPPPPPPAAESVPGTGYAGANRRSSEDDEGEE